MIPGGLDAGVRQGMRMAAQFGQGDGEGAAAGDPHRGDAAPGNTRQCGRSGNQYGGSSKNVENRP